MYLCTHNRVRISPVWYMCVCECKNKWILSICQKVYFWHFKNRRKRHWNLGKQIFAYSGQKMTHTGDISESLSQRAKGLRLYKLLALEIVVNLKFCKTDIWNIQIESHYELFSIWPKTSTLRHFSKQSSAFLNFFSNQS